MATTKNCPYCGEEILAVAKKCKHCGEWLEEKNVEPQKQAKKKQGEGVFMHYFVDVIKNHYLDFHRSVTRKEYWLFNLFSGLIFSCFSLLCTCFWFQYPGLLSFFIMCIVGWVIYGAGFFIPSLAMVVCRFRDIGKKWTNLFWVLIPYVGPIILLVFFCMKGKKSNTGNVKMEVFDYVIIIVLAIVIIGAFWSIISNAFDVFAAFDALYD